MQFLIWVLIPIYRALPAGSQSFRSDFQVGNGERSMSLLQPDTAGSGDRESNMK